VSSKVLPLPPGFQGFRRLYLPVPHVAGRPAQVPVPRLAGRLALVFQDPCYLCLPVPGLVRRPALPAVGLPVLSHPVLPDRLCRGSAVVEGVPVEVSRSPPRRLLLRCLGKTRIQTLLEPRLRLPPLVH